MCSLEVPETERWSSPSFPASPSGGRCGVCWVRPRAVCRGIEAGEPRAVAPHPRRAGGRVEGAAHVVPAACVGGLERRERRGSCSSPRFRAGVVARVPWAIVVGAVPASRCRPAPGGVSRGLPRWVPLSAPVEKEGRSLGGEVVGREAPTADAQRLPCALYPCRRSSHTRPVRTRTQTWGDRGSGAIHLRRGRSLL